LHMASEQQEISRLEQANALGLQFLKTIILLNGGAILALLTFIGNSTANPAVQFDLANIKVAMWSFLAGISSMLVALLFSYSYTATAPEYGYHQFWDRHIIPVNSSLGFVSLACFIAGVSSLILGAKAA